DGVHGSHSLLLRMSRIRQIIVHPFQSCRMATTHRWLKSFRTLHLYFGASTAPALLFFAFTGALQSVNLHEAAWQRLQAASMDRQHRAHAQEAELQRAGEARAAIMLRCIRRPERTSNSPQTRPATRPPSRRPA